MKSNLTKIRKIVLSASLIVAISLFFLGAQAASAQEQALAGSPAVQQISPATSVKMEDPLKEKTSPEEFWNAHFQFTGITQKKSAFNANYSGTNSLITAEENPYSFTSTIYLGARAWKGAELYLNPEMISAMSASGLHGLGGLTNGEQQKSTSTAPLYYIARAFLRQSFYFGDEKEHIEGAANQLGGEVAKRRIVVSVGKMSIIDIFDNNSYAHDARSQFTNWSFLDYGAYDYAADAQGYTVGGAIEFYYDDWVFRVGRFEGPQESNGLPLDPYILDHYGDQIEVEHSHTVFNQPGKIKVLGFRNQEVMGNFEDAINFAAANGGVSPDVGTVRRLNIKYGYGISLEQSINPDMGFFARAGLSDGKSETYSFTEIENSVTAGFVSKAIFWGRDADKVSIALAQNDLTSIHQKYLSQGGTGAFIGDGALRYRAERVVEVNYNLNLYKTSWLTIGFQRIDNPAYNADRGPVNVSTLRLHAEL